MQMTQARIEATKKNYPAGTKLCLDAMDGEPQMRSGLKGEVFAVDDMGQIHVSWENGSTLAVIPGVDHFHKISSQKKAKEVPTR